MSVFSNLIVILLETLDGMLYSQRLINVRLINVHVKRRRYTEQNAPPNTISIAEWQ